MKKFMDIVLLMALVAGVTFAGDSDKHDANQIYRGASSGAC